MVNEKEKDGQGAGVAGGAQEKGQAVAATFDELLRSSIPPGMWMWECECGCKRSGNVEAKGEGRWCCAMSRGVVHSLPTMARSWNCLPFAACYLLPVTCYLFLAMHASASLTCHLAPACPRSVQLLCPVPVLSCGIPVTLLGNIIFTSTHAWVSCEKGIPCFGGFWGAEEEGIPFSCPWNVKLSDFFLRMQGMRWQLYTWLRKYMKFVLL